MTMDSVKFNIKRKQQNFAHLNTQLIKLLNTHPKHNFDTLVNSLNIVESSKPNYLIF